MKMRHKAFTKFIHNAKMKFGDKLDFSKSRYIDSKTPIEYNCKYHGVQKSTPHSIMSSKTGCSICGKVIPKREPLTVTSIQNRLDNEFGKGAYTVQDKQLTDGRRGKVTLTCNKLHRDGKTNTFTLTVENALKYEPCHKCKTEIDPTMNMDDVMQIDVSKLPLSVKRKKIEVLQGTVMKFNQAIKEKGYDPANYDLSKLPRDYVNTSSQLEIRCKKHNVTYTSNQQKLILGAMKCEQCKAENTNRHGSRAKTAQMVVDGLREIHGSTVYDFTWLLKNPDKIVLANDPIVVKCNRCHNDFNTTPAYIQQFTVKGYGCPKCIGMRKNSKQELTFPEWKRSAIAKFGNAFKYYGNTWKGRSVEMKMWHPDVGEFWMKPLLHLKSTYGYRSLVDTSENIRKVMNMNRHETIKSIVDGFRAGVVTKGLDPDDYDLGDLEKSYMNMRTKLNIRCKLHDVVFETTGEKLKLGRVNCKQCRAKTNVRSKQVTTEEAIAQVERAHGKGVFDFKLVREEYPKYLKAKDRIKVKCINCGSIMKTTKDNLLGIRNKGIGCTSCVRKALPNTTIAYTYNDFTIMADDVHGGKGFKYKTSDWNGYSKPMKMWHPDIGVFMMTPQAHIDSPTGAAALKTSRIGINKHTYEQFLEKLEETHGKDRFITHKEDYVDVRTPIKVECHRHFKPYIWKATPRDLTLKTGYTGCPRCNCNSAYETMVHDVLDYFPVTVVKEYKLPEVQDSDDRDRLYRYDFYIPELRMLIEMDDDTHLRDYTKSSDSDTYKKHGVEIKQRDAEKTKLAMRHNYNLLRLDQTFDNMHKVKRAVKTYLNATFPYRYNDIWYSNDVELREALEANKLNPKDLKPYRYTWKEDPKAIEYYKDKEW